MLCLFAPLTPIAAAFAQANANDALDVVLADIADLVVFERTGPFPDGVNACAFETTVCNAGTEPIPWRAAMDPNHPFFAFLLAREVDGRLEQISDRSWIKHGVYPTSHDFCGACSFSSGGLGVGCSDTYVWGNNVDTYWLGPPDEIDPWTGRWDPFCSHFDRGNPPEPPETCDGDYGDLDGGFSFRPLHCIFVRDADLAEPRTPFWFQAMVVIAGERESKRGDDLASRAFTPVWTGSTWDLVEGGTMLPGSVLQRWGGATVASSTNGSDDGRVYVAVKVTGPDPDDGFYHYEYAVHERDNARGIGALRIPVCSGARVRDIGFRDVDQDAGNDWTASVAGNEIVFSGAGNPLLWNTIFNFWFDSDAAPLVDTLALDQARPGPGARLVSVASRAPLALAGRFLGSGCDLDAPPTLFANGRATLGNAAFALVSAGNAPFQPSVLRCSLAPGSFVLGGCERYVGPRPGWSFAGGRAVADAAGRVVFALPVPNEVALEGLSVAAQSMSRDPGQGVVRGSFDLSDGVRVQVGDALPACR